MSEFETLIHNCSSHRHNLNPGAIPKVSEKCISGLVLQKLPVFDLFMSRNFLLSRQFKKNVKHFTNCVSSLCRGHTNLFCIALILIYVLPKWALLWQFFVEKIKIIVRFSLLLTQGSHKNSCLIWAPYRT